MKIKLYIIKLILLLVSFSYSNTGAFSISRIHYDGGGDWCMQIKKLNTKFIKLYKK